MRMLHGGIAGLSIVHVQQRVQVSVNSREEYLQPKQNRGLSIMAYISTASFAKPSRARRSTGFFAGLKLAYTQRRLYVQTLNELSRLNDRELADLGISRLSIAQVAHEAAYGK